MDFLRKFAKPTFQNLSYGQGVVKFTCSKSLKTGDQVDGSALFPGGVRAELSVKIEESESGFYAATVLGPPETQAMLEKTFLPNQRDTKNQMFYKPDEEALTRHARTYSMRCRDFPNFKGVTAELSREGAFVFLSGPVEVGTKTEVTIDLDHEEIDPFTIGATVDWCLQREEKVWVCTLSFDALPEETDDVLKDFLEKLKNRVPGTRAAL